MEIYSNSQSGYKIDTIYSTQMSMIIQDQPLVFDIDFIDGEKTYLILTAITKTYSSIASDNADYFLEKFKMLPDCDALRSSFEWDEVMDIYSYEELKNYREDSELEYQWIYIADKN
jgi:hypothetical protein